MKKLATTQKLIIPKASSSGQSAAATAEENGVKVDSRDVIRLMLQFCMENNLSETFTSMVKETGIACNTMMPHTRKQFLLAIEKGNWSNVLEVLQQPYLIFSKSLLWKVYEHVVYELVEISEEEVAKYLLGKVEVYRDMKEEDPSRFRKLEHVINTARHFDPLIAYDGKNKQDIRKELSALFQQELINVPASALLSIIGNAIEYKKGIQGDDFDPNTFHLLDHTMKNMAKREKTVVKQEEEDQMEATEDNANVENPSTEMIMLEKPYKIIKFGKKTKVNCCHFVSDYLVTGTTDGFVEIYDYVTGKLNKELLFQANDEMIVHEDSVTCVNTKVQPSGILLVTASLDKTIKIWNMLTGKCLMKIATPSAVNVIYFSNHDNTIISGYPNGSIKVHGLTSGGVELKDFSGHRSFVNSIIQFDDGEKILSCSSDGTIRLWNFKSLSCERVYSAESMRKNDEMDESDNKQFDSSHLPIHQIMLYPFSKNHVLVCYPCNWITVMDLESGKETFRFVSSKKEDEFVSFSIESSHLYGVTSTNKCFVFQMPEHVTQKLDEVSPVRIDTDLQHKKPVTGILQHPKESIIATFSPESINLWK